MSEKASDTARGGIAAAQSPRAGAAAAHYAQAVQRWRIALTAVPIFVLGLVLLIGWLLPTWRWGIDDTTDQAFIAGTLSLAFVAREVVRALRDRWWAKRSAAWPVAAGRIIESRAEYHWRPSSDRKYRAVVRYDYQVGGRNYVGDRILFSQHYFWGFPDAQKSVEPYPVGAEVPVRYDPEEPSRAVLETSDRAARHRLGMAALVAAVAFGLLAYVFSGAK